MEVEVKKTLTANLFVETVHIKLKCCNKGEGKVK